MTDHKLVAEFLETRSEKAFRELYRSKTPSLYGLALRLCEWDKSAADDLLQETWMVAIQQLGKFQWRSALRTWLTGILINLHRKAVRRDDRMTGVTGIEFRIETDNDRILDLEKAIASLPDGYRTLIVLHDIEGYNHEEIAIMLDIVPGTSKSQLFHARKKMRELLK